MSDYIQVITTTASKEQAQQIASELVSRRLAACVQVVGPIFSTFSWQGAVETSSEWQCIAKSRRELYERIEAAIRELHHYDVPEILAVPIVAGSKDYLAWVDSETDPA